MRHEGFAQAGQWRQPTAPRAWGPWGREASSATIGACIHRSGVLLYVDEAAAAAFGFASAADLLGSHVLALLKPADRPVVSERLQGDRSAHLQVRLAGEDALVELFLSGVRVGGGGLQGIFVQRLNAGATLLDGDGEVDTVQRKGSTRNPKVLICDDEERLASLTAGLLEEYGYEPVTVDSGDKALDLLARAADAIDVVLLDVNLSGGLTAKEVLGRMHHRGDRARVILSSGLPEEDVSEELTGDPSVVGYLPKPYSVEQLVRLVERACGRA